MVSVLVCLIAACCLVSVGVEASYGDRHPFFTGCVDVCRNCCRSVSWGRPATAHVVSDSFGCSDFPSDTRSWLDVRLGWDCSRECVYQCMWRMVTEMRRQGYPVVQFYGRWPFIRLLALQEPASVLFSLLNLLTFFYLAQQVYQLPSGCPMRAVWALHSALGMFTWLCSCVFHARDTRTTELFDYCSAGASIVCCLYCCICRLCCPTAGTRTRLKLAVPFCAYFIAHVRYLLTGPRFDYGYNMKANVLLGVITSALWLVWCARRANGVWPGVGSCAAVVVLGNVTLALELLDFAPIGGHLDAHALWHLTTVPLPVIWARFVRRDCRQLLLTNTPVVRQKVD